MLTRAVLAMVGVGPRGPQKCVDLSKYGEKCSFPEHRIFQRISPKRMGRSSRIYPGIANITPWVQLSLAVLNECIGNG